MHRGFRVSYGVFDREVNQGGTSNDGGGGVAYAYLYDPFAFDESPGFSFTLLPCYTDEASCYLGSNPLMEMLMRRFVVRFAH